MANILDSWNAEGNRKENEVFLHPWISADQSHSSYFSILNGTDQVQKLSTFNFINHRKSLTSKHKNNKRTTNQILGYGYEGHMKIWLDSHVILWREGKYTSMYKYVLHRPFCVWLKAKNSNCVSSWIKHYFKCKISQSLATEGPWWMLKFKTRETPKIRNRELYNYYHHFIRILLWYRNK